MNITYDEIYNEYYLSPEELANELCLLYDCSVLVVEGESDAFFWNHIHNDNLKIYIACNKKCKGNKDYVIQVIQLLNQRNCTNIKISGIIDLDYDYVENRILKMNNLYYYLFHDFEVMLIKSKAFKTVNSLISSKSKRINTDELRKLLFQSTYPLGIIRWMNEKYQMGINFDKFRIDKLFDFSKRTPDENNFLNYLQASLKLTKPNADIFRKRYYELKNLNHDPEYICNGHDILILLSLLTNRIISNDNPIKYFDDIITHLLSAEYHVQHVKAKEDILTYCDILNF